MIESVHIKQDGKGAFVKFKTVDDVEFAIKRNDKKSNMHIYRCTEHQMQMDRKSGNGHLSLPPVVPAFRRRNLTKSGSKTLNDSLHAVNFLKVHGLPWTVSESYVFDLFPGK